MSPSPSGTVRSADRALELVEYVAAAGDPLSVAQMRGELGIPQSTLYALLKTLKGRGWLECEPDGRYRLGIRALLVGRRVVELDPVAHAARDVMRRTRDRLDETIHLGRLNGDEIVYLASELVDHALTVRSVPGRRLPAFTTALGKALLAERLEGDLDRHLPQQLTPRSPHTITDREVLLRDLRATRERGYARDDQEGSLGVFCVAVAIRDATPPVTALSCSVAQPRFGEERRQEIATVLLAARDEIDANLGVRATATSLPR